MEKSHKFVFVTQKVWWVILTLSYFCSFGHFFHPFSEIIMFHSLSTITPFGYIILVNIVKQQNLT